MEAYIFDYNRFLRGGKNHYFILQLFYGHDTSVLEIKSTSAQFKLPKELFFEKAYSESVSPVHIGTLTGLVTAMIKSKNFYEVFKHKFKLSDLVLYLSIPKTKGKREWTKNKSSLHIEISRTDLHTRKHIEAYSNQFSRSLDNTFFGITMFLTPSFNYFAEDKVITN